MVVENGARSQKKLIFDRNPIKERAYLVYTIQTKTNYLQNAMIKKGQNNL